jgi:hypothetical protein
MRSSAAPTYFPIYQNFIDGGVVANNPSMCALAQAINTDTGKQALDNVVLLSIGTGAKAQFVDSLDGDWGLEQWGFKIIDLLLEGGGGLADYQCRQLLGARYIRIDVQLQDTIGLDAAEKLSEIIQLADEIDLEEAVSWLETYWTSAGNQDADRAA